MITLPWLTCPGHLYISAQIHFRFLMSPFFFWTHFTLLQIFGYYGKNLYFLLLNLLVLLLLFLLWIVFFTNFVNRISTGFQQDFPYLLVRFYIFLQITPSFFSLYFFNNLFLSFYFFCIFITFSGLFSENVQFSEKPNFCELNWLELWIRLHFYKYIEFAKKKFVLFCDF